MRLIGVLATGALLTGLAVAPAQADRAVHRDPRGDVWSPVGMRGFEPSGSVHNVDLRKTTVTHRAGSVVLLAKYVALGRGFDETSFTLYLRTDHDRRFSIYSFVDWLGRYASVHVSHGIDELPVRCERAHAAVSFRKDSLRIVVPRSCLRTPSWVRYQALAEAYTEDDGLWRDNALGRGARLDSWSGRIERG